MTLSNYDNFMLLPFILWLSGILFGEGNGTPLQYSCLENSLDRGAWWAAVHGVAKSQTWLRDFTFTFHFFALEKEMATCSSVLAWRIPVTGEPGGLPSMGSHRIRHNWSDLAAAAAVFHYNHLYFYVINIGITFAFRSLTHFRAYDLQMDPYPLYPPMPLC